MQVFSSATLSFPAMGEDHGFFYSLVVPQLWDVPLLVLCYLFASILKPYVCAGILGEASGVLLIPCIFS